MSEVQTATPRRTRRVIYSVLGLLVLVGLMYAAFLWFTRQQAATPRINYSLTTPQRGDLSASVNASGSIQAANVVNLNFSASGTVAEVLVEVGDRVAQDAPLVQLDDEELQLRVAQAEAGLAQARASYARLVAGATPQEVAAAQAQLEQAQAQLRQVQGNVTASDITAARAQLEQARARLAQLLAGPKNTDLAAAQAQLDQANANAQTQRDNLSAAKSRAQSQMEQAANTVRDRQADYSRIYWNNRQLEEQLAKFGNELPQQNKDQEAAALRAVENAQASLEQAQLAYEQARQAEISGLEAVEAQVRSAQANLDKLLNGADADQIAAARAQVAQAEASLAKLLGDQRAGSLAAASAGVESAQANLERITAQPREYDLASALAQVQNAEATLKQAQLALSRATLRAPFAGTVAEIHVKAGELLNLSRPAVVLADLTAFHVDVTVDEIDVAQLAEGQPVTLTLDALPNLNLTGTVSMINPLSNVGSAVTAYQVRIETPASDTRVRPGMSANADIVVAQKQNALIVPRRAVRAEQGRLFVDTLQDPALCQADQSTWPVQPQLTPVEVTTGLSNEFAIEISSGNLRENSCIYVAGVDARLNLLSGPPPGVRNRGN